VFASINYGWQELMTTQSIRNDNFGGSLAEKSDFKTATISGLKTPQTACEGTPTLTAH
jgi:hypothetical protein